MGRGMAAVIIGGGIAGLSAALRLVQAGQRPVLLEPGEAGGMVRSRLQDGFTRELGPNVLVERPDIVELLHQLGLSHEAQYPSVDPYGQYVWHNGKARKVPTGLLDLLGSPLFSAQAKVALPLRIVRKGVLRARGDDSSVLDFFAPLIGAGAANAVLDPVLKGIYGGDVSTLSARSLFPGLWRTACDGLSVLQYLRSKPKGGKPRIFVVRGGNQRITEELLRVLEGKIDWVADAASEVRRTPSGFEVATAGGRVIPASACIVTTAGGISSSFIRHIEPELAKTLAEVQFAGLTAVHLSVSREETLIRDAFGVLCPGGMPENFLGVMFNSLIFPQMAPPDRHLLTVMVGGAQAGDTVPDTERLKTSIPHLLREMFGVTAAEWLGSLTWRKAIPQLTVGHHRVVEALDAAEARNPGLVFVGVDRGGVGVSDRLRVVREGLERVKCAALPRVA